MSDGTSLAVPAGWYPDRNEANLVRWWDGQQWTDQTHSTAPAAAAFEQPDSAAAFGFQSDNSAGQIPAGQIPAGQVPPVQNVVPSAAAQPAPIQHPATQSPLIAPGWYPDNADPALQRWWDGTQWTTHTTQTAQVTGPGPVSSSSNSMATLSLVISIVSFAGLIFVVLLPLSLAGIIIGGVALRRARRYAPSARRRGQAITGIILGSLSLIVTVLLSIAAVMVYQHVHSAVPPSRSQQSTPSSGGITFPSTIDELKQQIATSLTRDTSVAVTGVTCDAAASMVSGSAFDCGVQVADGRWTSVRVNITNPAGSGMGYGLGYGPLLGAGDTPATPEHSLDEIVHQQTMDLAQAWQVTVASVTCDPAASLTQGSTFGCRVSLSDGRTGDVVITMTPPYGYDVTVVHLPAGVSGSGSGSDGSGSGSSSGSDPDHLNS